MSADDGAENELEARNDSGDDLPAQPAVLGVVNLADRIPSAGGSDIGARAPDDAATE